eukprot:3385114-Lingulodinium_polyedra.AAC.1
MSFCGLFCNLRVTAFSLLTSKFVGHCTRWRATTYTCIHACVNVVYARAPRKLTNWSATTLVAFTSGGAPVSSCDTMGRNEAMYSS